MSFPHVVIIGGGFGGLSGGQGAAQGAGARHGARSSQPPPLPAAAVPGRDGNAVAWRYCVADPVDPAPRAKHARPARRGPRDRSHDAARHAGGRVRRSSTTILIVATGTSHTYFGHDDWATYAPGLKTLEDALDIRRRILVAFEHAERETDRGEAAAAVDVCARRWGAHRRRACRNACRNRPPDPPGVPQYRHAGDAHCRRRGRADNSSILCAEAARRRATHRCCGCASRFARTRGSRVSMPAV